MMIKSIEIIDYILLALSCFFVIMGLFRGASGFFSFISATIVSATVALTSWPIVCGYINSAWIRVLAIIVLVLLAYGAVRCLVGWLVNKLLAQPADAIFGMVLGAVLGALLIYIAANTALIREYSVIAREVSHLINVEKDVR